MNGVYEVTLPGAARFPDDPPPVEWALHVSTAKLPRAADRWDAPHGVAVPVPVGGVVALPESGDQSAVTVRMCYPPRRECRSGRWPVVPQSRPMLSQDFEEFSRNFNRFIRLMGGDVESVREDIKGPVVSGSAGDGSNSGEKADAASGFVTGSCPDRPVNPKIAKLFLNAWGNMCGGEQ